MLLFMPWCRIDNRYQVGDVELLPFNRHQPIEGIDDLARCRVNTIMAAYKTIEGKPIDSASLVCRGGKSPTDDLSEEEVEVAYELVALACFCALAKRDYFNSLGFYCNSDCFVLYVQKFNEADFTSLRTRRREGSTLSGWPIDDITITIPVHCHTVREVSLDGDLLRALTAYRAECGPGEWTRWQNAISCFNQANTDGESVRYQVEWVLLCSAFQQLLGAKSDADDVASKFSVARAPHSAILVDSANRRSNRSSNGGIPLRQDWMREFYGIRGDFAHGKLNTQQPAAWNPLEHLVLGTIAFPLVVKSLLQKAGKYELTTNDQAQIDMFEALADTEKFLKPPPNQKNSLDSHWKRLCDARKLELTIEKALEKHPVN